MLQFKSHSNHPLSRLWLILLLVLSPLTAMATEYVGTLRVDDKMRNENVRVEVNKIDNNHIEMILYRVKFHRLMPLRITVKIENIEKQGNDISLNYGIPKIMDTDYERRPVRDLRGQISDRCMWFRATIGKSAVMFTTNGHE